MANTAHFNCKIGAEFAFAWLWAERMFEMLDPQALFQRPISLRHPNIFYLGHLPSFACNQIFRAALNRQPFNEAFDRIFERGIDPPDTADYAGCPQNWPPVREILSYKRKAQCQLEELLNSEDLEDEKNARLKSAVEMTLEHYLMHIETFFYMQHQLDHALKREIAPLSSGRQASGALLGKRVKVPAGASVLGAATDQQFGWCNEHDQLSVWVDDFEIDRYPVTNRQFLDFIESGGYQRQCYWGEESWRWLGKTNKLFPNFWRRDGDRWLFRGLFEWQPLDMDWPVWVSKAEADAFAKWKKADLPGESEFHRAAYGTASADRLFPWAGAAEDGCGNFGLRSFLPQPVGNYPQAASFWGVHELVGNGWEWTATPFSPFPGFRPLPSYPGYSADFFDGRHFVLKGASPLTAIRLIRRSFRNWYQAHYPYVYGKFRCVYREGAHA